MIVLSILGSVWANTPEFNGDLKQFFIAGLPYDHILMPPSSYGLAYADARAKVRWELTEKITFEGHHVVTAGTAPPSSQLFMELESLGVSLDDEDEGSLLMTGVGLSAPEAIELSWSPEEESDLFLQGRTDRLLLKGSFGTVDLVVGRQAISFGDSLFFTPMDLVQPFSVATIDSEYKPGIDAFRVDSYFGFSGQITALVAYAGSWDQEGLIALFNANTTVGIADLSLFYSSARGDHVVGTGVSTSIGAVGVHLEGTFTLPYDEDVNEEDSFVRAVVGFFWQPLEKSTLTGELYLQTLGAEDPNGYLELAQSERFARGELWLMGRSYGALSWGQEITPLVNGALAGFCNLEDGSFLLSPSLSISVSDNVQAALGGYAGFGERPEDIELAEIIAGEELALKSEFGFMPGMLFLQMRSYF